MLHPHHIITLLYASVPFITLIILQRTDNPIQKRFFFIARISSIVFIHLTTGLQRIQKYNSIKEYLYTRGGEIALFIGQFIWIQTSRTVFFQELMLLNIGAMILGFVIYAGYQSVRGTKDGLFSFIVFTGILGPTIGILVYSLLTYNLSLSTRLTLIISLCAASYKYRKLAYNMHHKKIHVEEKDSDIIRILLYIGLRILVPIAIFFIRDRL